MIDDYLNKRRNELRFKIFDFWLNTECNVGESTNCAGYFDLNFSRAQTPNIDECMNQPHFSNLNQSCCEVGSSASREKSTSDQMHLDHVGVAQDGPSAATDIDVCEFSEGECDISKSYSSVFSSESAIEHEAYSEDDLQYTPHPTLPESSWSPLESIALLEEDYAMMFEDALMAEVKRLYRNERSLLYHEHLMSKSLNSCLGVVVIERASMEVEDRTSSASRIWTHNQIRNMQSEDNLARQWSGISYESSAMNREASLSARVRMHERLVSEINRMKLCDEEAKQDRFRRSIQDQAVTSLLKRLQCRDVARILRLWWAITIAKKKHSILVIQRHVRGWLTRKRFIAQYEYLPKDLLDKKRFDQAQVRDALERFRHQIENQIDSMLVDLCEIDIDYFHSILDDWLSVVEEFGPNLCDSADLSTHQVIIADTTVTAHCEQSKTSCDIVSTIHETPAETTAKPNSKPCIHEHFPNACGVTETEHFSNAWNYTRGKNSQLRRAQMVSHTRHWK